MGVVRPRQKPRSRTIAIIPQQNRSRRCAWYRRKNIEINDPDAKRAA
jgi:hypothetical protein